MSEGDFWNNLDGFVEKQNNGKDTEKVDDWLKNVPDPDKSQPQQQKSAMKSKSPTG